MIEEMGYTGKNCPNCRAPMEPPEPYNETLGNHCETFWLCQDCGYADDNGFYGWGALPGEEEALDNGE